MNKFNVNGMTVIEIILVIVILGVVAAIIPVSYIRYDRYLKLKNTAERIVADMENVRAQNINDKSVSSYISFDSVNNRYLVKLKDDYDTVTVEDEIVMVQAPVAVVFNRKGISNSVAGDTLIITNGEKTAVINTLPVTGSINYEIK